jgi:hypothetical protein
MHRRASVYFWLGAVWARFAYVSFLEFRNGYYARNRLLDHINDDDFAYRNAFLSASAARFSPSPWRAWA